MTASKRQLVIAACHTSDKRHYITREQAVVVASHRTSRPGKAHFLRVYECPCGGGFCLTRQPLRS